MIPRIARVPTKLATQPIVEVNFEIRFAADVPLSRLLPGVLFSTFAGDKQLQIASLPAAELPEVMRQGDLKFRYLPVVEVRTSLGPIRIADTSVIVSASIPYPGWSEFRVFIAKVVETVFSCAGITKIERYSVKYVDFLNAEIFSRANVRECLRLGITLGEESVRDEATDFRAEFSAGGLVHLVEIRPRVNQIVAGATPNSGVLLSVDSIKVVESTDVSATKVALLDRINDLHAANKNLFFACLHPEAIDALGPTYDE